jgi:hypothetical protein
VDQLVEIPRRQKYSKLEGSFSLLLKEFGNSETADITRDIASKSSPVLGCIPGRDKALLFASSGKRVV